jgi:Bacterial Ig-like domain (group 3)/YDG domain/MBG domain (YGX type)
MQIRKRLTGRNSAKILKCLCLALLSSTAAATTTNLVFTTQPTSTTVGAPLANVVVQLRTSLGTNVSIAGIPVTVSLSKGVGLGGVKSIATDSTGKSVFTNLTVAQYGLGDTLLAASTVTAYKTATSAAFNVTQGRTANAVSFSANPITYGQFVTVTSTVSVFAPSAGTPTGTVTFKDGATILGTSPLISSIAVFTTTSRLLAGNHYISVVYSGDTNFSATSASAVLTVSKLPLTVSGIAAINKIYNANTIATLNTSNSVLNGILPGDNVALNTANARGIFSDKNVAVNKTVSISGLTISGTNVANYSLTQPTTIASILPASLRVLARGVNKIYDGTPNATVTLNDNRYWNDILTDSYTSAVFTNKNIGSAKTIFVSGISISGADAANYSLTTTTTTATANITAASLTISGITASNKIYNANSVATLNFSGSILNGAVGGDVLSLVTTNARGSFPNKNVGTNLTVKISGLAISGMSASNYSLVQQTTTASISSANLTVAAKGVNKIYDGSIAATVTLSDNRFAGDALTDSYTNAVFATAAVATNKMISITGIAVSGNDSGNYILQNTTATAAANITAAKLLVAADNLSRAYGTTNPPLTYTISGFVNGETAASATVGAPLLSTTAKLTSVVSNYPITISKGTLAAANYVFVFSNAVLSVTPAPTVSLVASGLNPARTNQNILFTTKVSSPNYVSALPTGLVRFKCNGTNLLTTARPVS